MKRFLSALILGCASLAQAGTVTGSLIGPSGLPVANGAITFRLQQAGLAIGSGNIAALSSQCFTSADGTVVGIPNPLTLPVISVNYGSGAVPAGTYYVQTAYYTTNSTASLPSPEAVVQLTSAGSFIVAAPLGGVPPGAAGFVVYASTTSGGETGQGQSASPTSSVTIGGPLNPAGEAPVGANNTVCSIAFNDTIIPYTGYNVSLVSSSGNAYPGWPQAWQLNGGLSGIVNVSAGAPLWNGVTVFPQPIVAQPLNHGPQSIAGLLNMTGYNIVNVAALGIGTTTPAYPLDVENGYINTNLGYLVAGGAGTSGQCLVSNGTFFGPGSCGTLPTIYYQHMQRTGSLQAQEPFLNFSGNFGLTDNPGSTRTEVDLAPTSVTAGTYSNATITVDAYGRLQAASSPTSGLPSQIEPLVINSGICSTGTSGTAPYYCSFGVTWPTAFVDNSYAVTCSPNSAGIGGLTALMISNKTSTGFELTVQSGTANMATNVTLTEIDCVGVHP